MPGFTYSPPTPDQPPLKGGRYLNIPRTLLNTWIHCVRAQTPHCSESSCIRGVPPGQVWDCRRRVGGGGIPFPGRNGPAPPPLGDTVHVLTFYLRLWRMLSMRSVLFVRLPKKCRSVNQKTVLLHTNGTNLKIENKSIYIYIFPLTPDQPPLKGGRYVNIPRILLNPWNYCAWAQTRQY